MRSDHEAANTSPVTVRIGPVYSVDDLVASLRYPGGLDDAASVEQAADEKQLVGFLTTDGRWAFPEWSFERAGGHLTLRDGVAELWRDLPHDGFLTDADLCAWMNTRTVGLGEMSPVKYVALNGIDSHLRGAAGRLNARAR